MHCESVLEKANLPYQAWVNFTTWWQSLITKEKYNRVDELLGTPLCTNTVTKDIFDQLGKFIDAQDRYIEFKFSNPDYTNDFADFLDRMQEDSFWRSRCIDAIKTDICSVVVIDLPAQQTTMRPEPYQYFVSPRMFVDIDYNKYNGRVEYFIYRQSKISWDDTYVVTANNTDSKFNLLKEGTELERIIVLDDTYYRVFVKDKKSKDFFLLSEVAHNLGYAPCIDFWQPSIKGTNGINKRGPITAVLKKLDYYLFYQALADYMDLYGPFPILVMYDTEDEQFDDKTKEVNTGQNYSKEQYSAISNAPNVTDPRKKSRALVGPGTRYTVPVPAGKDDHNFMETPMKFVGMDVDALKHVQERLKQLSCQIVEICTGEDMEYLNEIAKNPEMMSASYERKDTILTWIKRQVERVHRFSTQCRAELRYGKEYLVSVTVDYGSDYFLKDSTMLVKEFKEAKDNGMPQGYTSEVARAASNTRYKNNPDILARLRILNDLEPYPNMSLDQMKQLGITDRDIDSFIIKSNFITFINQFEMENGSIVEFGSLIPYPKKISIINAKLKSYATERGWKEPAKPEGKPSGQPAQ